MKRIIPKGFHRPLQLIPACFRNMKKGGAFEFSKTVLFTSSCRYDFESGDQYDWNKLFGISSWRIRKDSWRFAWRNLDNDNIEVCAYCYDNGKRWTSSIAFLPLKKSHTFTIERDEDGYILFKVNGRYLAEVHDEKKRKFFWGCGLYFGDNRRAPHNIVIEYYNGLTVSYGKIITKDTKDYGRGRDI